MPPAVRRSAALTLLLGIAMMPAAALAQDGEPAGPVVDVVEIAGIIDRQLQGYAVSRIDEAERDGAALLVFQVDSLGAMKITPGTTLPEVVERIRDSSVPIAVHVGPRRSRAAGVVMFMAAAAHVSSIGLSAEMGPVLPLDHAHPDAALASEFGALHALRGRSLGAFDPDTTRLGQRDSIALGWADVGAPSVAAMLEQIDGRAVTTAAGPTTLSLPRDDVEIRFFQPGVIRRLLHTFANPTLVYLMLLAGALMVMFELFQPGFGVAGVTGGVVLVAAAFGLTVLPARSLGLGLLIGGLVLLTMDVALDGLGIPTILGTGALIAGSLLVFPSDSEPTRLSPWLIGLGVASALVVFVPVMTVVSRARTPIAREARTQLLDEVGQVRSMLNPEGFVFVDGEVWRARSKDGSRVRVGETVVVDGVDGAVLIVRGDDAPTNGAGLAGDVP